MGIPTFYKKRGVLSQNLPVLTFVIREWYFDQYLPIVTLILEMGHVSFCPDLPIFKLGHDRVWWVPMIVTEYTCIPHESPHSINGGQLSILSICLPSRNRKIGG